MHAAYFIFVANTKNVTETQEYAEWEIFKHIRNTWQLILCQTAKDAACDT